ncbi:hypothetical protein G7Y89_g6425 [Cudoniella acicularis]|uniref:Cytochrome P450 n=1 Tax=Cudoniella acicularis TaxID=354080 RepID=A0A8H4RKH7_9HELO|nr:hypothetical protein G7Y89_g6425 [Cudoniella acicularis]
MESTITLCQCIATLCVVFILYVLRRVYTAGSTSNNWISQYPIIGIEKHWFSLPLATLRSFSESQRWAFEGYAKHSKANAPFIIPCLDRGNVVMIPLKQLKKVYGLPTSVLDVYETQNSTIQTKFTVGDQDIIKNSFQLDVIRHQITRNLEHLTPLISTELEEGFKRYWGDGTEWKELRIWDSCLKLIAGAANGAFCGAPLCRDVQFLSSLRDHAMTMFVGALFINATPSLLRPISGNLKDGLQWIIEESYATKDPQQLDPTRITHRLLYVNDISLHSTSFTMQNVILDLYNGENSRDLVEALREECAAVLKEASGSWTRAAVQKLKLADATIRESMRLTPFASVGLPRTVIHPGGISLESPNGKVHVPRGTVVAAPMDPIHRDEAIYPEAARFNPFRFIQPGGVRSILENVSPKPQEHDGTTDHRDGDEGKGRVAATRDDGSGRKDKSAVTLDDAFLGFGFGKHACPGRFFALNEMKMFVAYMVLNYDVECLDRRPELTNVIWLKVPYNDGRVRVRKRSVTTTRG